MKYLLDTNIFIWFTHGEPQLNKDYLSIIENSENQIYLSIVSVWEIGIKYSLGKLKLNRSFENYIPGILIENDIKVLNLSIEHIKKMITLPMHHSDPFDRLIIGQSLEENIRLLYSDEKIKKYFIN